jgi:hypothetical protein
MEPVVSRVYQTLTVGVRRTNMDGRGKPGHSGFLAPADSSAITLPWHFGDLARTRTHRVGEATLHLARDKRCHGRCRDASRSPRDPARPIRQSLNLRRVNAERASFVFAGGLCLGDPLALPFQHDFPFPRRHTCQDRQHELAGRVAGGIRRDLADGMCSAAVLVLRMLR